MMRAEPAGLALLCIATLALVSGCGTTGYQLGAVGDSVDVGDGAHIWTYRVYHDDRERDGFEGARAVAYYLPGSLAGGEIPGPGGARPTPSVTRAIGALAGFVMLNVRVVLIERRGIEPSRTPWGPAGIDEAALFAGSDKATRVADALAAIARDLPQIPPTTPILLIGASEGADIAAAVAARQPRVTHLLLMGGGGGMSQADELALLATRPTEPGCAAPGTSDRNAGIADALTPPELAAAFDAIRARPNSDETWLGQSFRRWSSFLWSPPSADLLTLSIPIFVAHGTCDQAVPVASARKLAEAFEAAGKRNLRYREYPGLGHDFRDARGRNGLPHVELDLVQWLTELGILNDDEARRYVARVRDAHPEWFGEP